MNLVDQKDRWLSAAVRFTLRQLARLPLKRLQQIGRISGTATVVLRTEALRITRINLTACYPDLNSRERERLIMSSLQHTGMVAAEMAAVWEWPAERILDLVERIEGRTLLESAAKEHHEGRGLIVLVPHLGNWELSGLFLGREFAIRSLYLTPGLANMDEYMRAVRERNGSKLVPAGKRGVMSLFTWLTSGGVTGILPDQSPDRSGGIFAPFFGIEAHTMKLVPRIISRTGARVLMMTSLRTSDGHFRVHFQNPPEAIYDKDLQTSATAMNAAIESLISLAPEQYQWEYKRFKHLPAKARNIYRA